MNAVLRVTIASALALACLDGHAKVVDKCIRTLEAHAGRPDAPTPCPKAIGYLVPRQAAATRPRAHGTSNDRSDVVKSGASKPSLEASEGDSMRAANSALHV